MINKKNALPVAPTTGRAGKKNRTVKPIKPIEKAAAATILFGNDISNISPEAIEQARVLMSDSDLGSTLELAGGFLTRFEKIEAADDKSFYLLARDMVRDSMRHKNYAALIRGAVAYEMGRDRRLLGGARKRDNLRQGRTAAYAEVATWSGYNRKQIEEDVKIFRCFYVEALEKIKDAETLRLTRIEILKRFLRYERAYFNAAFSTADPHRAIEQVIKAIEDASVAGERYSAAQFKRDLAATTAGPGEGSACSVKGAKDEDGENTTATERNKFVECFLTTEENSLLTQIEKREKISSDEAIGRSIRAFAAASAIGGENTHVE